MEIDKMITTGDERIVLFPRSYNKRGDERLHSVQGLTLDGREVNVKLRVDESMRGKEITPSIAEFSREDVKAKSPCLATPDNDAEHREGVLLFTGCEIEAENRKGIPTFTARWAYVLASHSDAQDPVFGLGRVVIIADNQAVKAIYTEIEDLEKLKPQGWEAIAERKRKALSDPLKLSYFGHLYQEAEEKSFAIENRDELTQFADSIFTSYTRNGVVGGVLIRLRYEDGALIPRFSTEVFPRWIRENTYQSGADVMKFFFRAYDQKSLKSGAVSFIVMPIKRYACGPSFKNYYFLKKPEESLLKIRKHFLINNEPTVSRIALALSRREESGESFMLKYYPLTNPLSPVATIGEEITPAYGEPLPFSSGLSHSADCSLRPKVGLSATTALDFPVWFKPHFIEHFPLALEEEPAQQADLNEKRASPPKGGNNDLAQEVSESVVPPLDLAEKTEQKSTQAPVSVNSTDSKSCEADEAEQQQEPTEAVNEGHSEEDDLSGMFSDLSQDEIEEAEKIAADSVSAAKLEAKNEVESLIEENDENFDPSIVGNVDSEGRQDEVVGEVEKGKENAESEACSLDKPILEVEQIEVDSEPIDPPIEELLIIDTSTDGQAENEATSSILLSEYMTSSRPSVVEAADISARPKKKNGLTAFLEKQGLL